MKYFTIIFSSTILIMLSFNPLLAQDTGSPELSTVIEVSQMEDGSKVMLEGFIGEQVGDDKYLFKDDTGTMTIEVENDTWRGQNVNEDIKVKIVGEYEKDAGSEEIQVEWLEIVELE